MLQHRPAGGRRGAMPYKKPFRAPAVAPEPAFNDFMFTTNQIPDNPGYMDFNNPTPPMNGPNANALPPGASPQKKKPNKNKQKPKLAPPLPSPQQQNGNSNWGNNKNLQPHNGVANKRLNNGMSRRFTPAQGMGPQHGGRRMIPMPVGPRGPMPPPVPPMHTRSFQPPIPRPPMGRGLPPIPPPFLRRNPMRGPMPLPPPMMPHMVPPRMPLGPPPPPFHNVGKIKKPNVKIVKKVIKSKSTIKTLKNLVNQYPIDKPWVTDEIRSEHDKKVEIENKLKGNKDDELFAQFKTQRDKFVGLYEKAREEYLKQEAAAVKSKDAKDKQTIKSAAAQDDIKK